MQTLRTTFVYLFGALLIAGIGLGGFPVTVTAAPLTNNLVLWVDAEDLDGDGVAEGLGESGLSGAFVTTWVDKAPDRGVNTATQGITADQPLLQLGAQNGRPVVRFDGVDDFLQNTALTKFSSALAQPTEMYLVWKADSSGGNASIAVDGLTNGFRQAIFDEFASGADYIRIFSGGSSIQTNALFTNAVVMTATFSQPNSSFRLNGSLAVAPGPTGTDALDGVTLGGRFALGTGSDRNSLDGYIAELLIYSAPLNSTDQQAVEGYLTAKWLTPEPVPEPSSLALWSLGGLLLLRRRRITLL